MPPNENNCLRNEMEHRPEVMGLLCVVRMKGLEPRGRTENTQVIESAKPYIVRNTQINSLFVQTLYTRLE